MILNIINLSVKWLGIDIGFWITTGISLLVAILMVIICWSLPPKNKKEK